MNNLYTFYPTKEQMEFYYITPHLMYFIVLNNAEKEKLSAQFSVDNATMNQSADIFIDKLYNEILNFSFSRAKVCADSLVKAWKHDFNFEAEIKNLDTVEHFNPTYCLASFIALETLAKENHPIKNDCSQLLMHYIENGGNVEFLKLYTLSQVSKILETSNKEDLNEKLSFNRQAMLAFSKSPYEMVFEYAKLCNQLSNKIKNIEETINNGFQEDHNLNFCIEQKKLYGNKLSATEVALKREIEKYDLETLSKIVSTRAKCAEIFSEMILHNEEKQEYIRPMLIGYHSKDNSIIENKIKEIQKEPKTVKNSLSK